MNSKDVLSRVFEITRDPRDGLLFLKEFQSLSPESFAILYADTETIFDSSEALFSDLKLLYQLDLFPFVILEVDSFQYLKVFFPLEQTNIEGEKSLGFSYQVVDRNLPLKEEVTRIIGQKKIPILLWEDESEKLSALIDRCRSILHSAKVIYVSIDGPLKDPNTSKVKSILQRDSHLSLPEGITLSRSQEEFFQLSDDLLSKIEDPKFSIVLTSPFTLLTELFTVKGSGTLVKRKNKIRVCHSTEDVDMKRVFQLIEESFGKPLKPEFYNTKFDVLFLEESYRACAWMQKTEHGFLLSKFAVNGVARGAGVGRDIWDQILEHCKPLFWRSKPDNNINKWYMSIAQGIEKDESWYYYWLGLNQSLIPATIQTLKSQPEDFFPK
ncbi:acetylglutamate kinase [Leptospira bandrabouensis]|uniref:acetylglutamate kinase n=1 Tax=Leptospira bandrabouensis TaxID=2484903 RepID=UPI001EE80AC5|nr:acetylglutamate kinase [Leptospira bandrabouensis]MCG6144703.1 acetylglutamate kinase [Leptospira bandrabouensis]MCG6152718.1 acetylglutamate kinase [Leptospira bandrabouensis]MCG6161665.1 acetylglutamate kinase [Leptospira bandrabouensis]MCG6164592.1 acetylglutamate kinase [Leptospira bandrabouensis]